MKTSIYYNINEVYNDEKILILLKLRLLKCGTVKLLVIVSAKLELPQLENEIE